ncbi:MAG: diaminopimelate epimerase [Eubacteriales bacterium]
MFFTKMHGLGNDFVIINHLDECISLDKEKIRFLCHRKYGIGSDGLIIVNSSKEAMIKMSYYNADGNEVEMCGNGIRCFAKYVYDNGIIEDNFITVETLAGIKEIEVILNGEKVQNVKVNMGAPIYQGKNIPIKIDKELVIDEQLIYNELTVNFSSLSMGNPHVVVQVEDMENYPKEEIGDFIEHHPLFPKGTNVNFCKIMNRNLIQVVTWERGVGLTSACGTGTCATVAILLKKGLLNHKVDAQLPGGHLFIEVQNNVFMTGEAVYVFSGEIQV